MEKTDELSLWRINVKAQKGRTEAESIQEQAAPISQKTSNVGTGSDEDGNLDWRHSMGGPRAWTGLGLDFVPIKEPLKSLSRAITWPLTCSREVILVVPCSRSLQNRKPKAGDNLKDTGIQRAGSNEGRVLEAAGIRENTDRSDGAWEVSRCQRRVQEDSEWQGGQGGCKANSKFLLFQRQEGGEENQRHMIEKWTTFTILVFLLR